MAEKRAVKWSLDEDSVVSEYIQSFRASSDRVRWVLYTVLVVSLAVAVMKWNLRDDGWARWRLNEYVALTAEKSEYDRLIASGKLSVAAEARLRELVPLLEQRAEFMKQMIARQQLVSIAPLFGTSFDYNELGVVGGIVVNILMLLLLFCFVRQHENLYLCSFKITRMCNRDRRHADGESMANFLYHTLVMTQVLHTPPTLARWHRRGSVPATLLRCLVFFLPAIVFACAAWIDYRALQSRNMPLRQGYAEFGLAAGLLLFGGAVYIYMRATDRLWRHMFLNINPHLRARPQRGWFSWVSLKPRWIRDEKEAPILAELPAEVNDAEAPAQTREAWVTETVRLPFWIKPTDGAYRIPTYLRKRMAKLLYRAATREARRDREVSEVKVTAVQVEESFVEARAWSARVRLQWPHRALLFEAAMRRVPRSEPKLRVKTAAPPPPAPPAP